MATQHPSRAFKLCGTEQPDEVGRVLTAGPLSVELNNGNLRYLRVGGVEVLRADFRLVAATHKPLRDMIEDGRFRPDLYYRISAFPIHLPALRERPGDIALLAASILQRIGNARAGSGDAGTGNFVLTDAARACLEAYAWPGNIRELRNVLERACLLADDGAIRVDHLPAEIVAAPAAPGAAERGKDAPTDHELVRIAGAFAGTRKALAEQLGMSERTLYRRMKALGLARRGG